MAKSSITEADVHRACEEMHARGEKPTQGKIIQLLGGSYSTVGPYVKTWRDGQETKERERGLLIPPELTAAWDHAVRRARGDAAEKWSTQIAEQDAQLEELRAEAAEMRAQLATLEAANLQLATERDRLAGKSEGLEGSLEVARKERQAALDQAKDAQLELARVAQVAEGLNARLADMAAHSQEQQSFREGLERRIAEQQLEISGAHAKALEAGAAVSLAQAQLGAEKSAREAAETRVRALEADQATYDQAISRAAAAEASATELRRQNELLTEMLRAKSTGPAGKTAEKRG
ncbi:chromosome segregation ATPase [Roseateles asaccharophilus]|uniref:DNA-binding protein n=1 Tax=Roseateles asaccharophilus TaxID=582607 RepID=UPI0038398480